MTGLAAAVLVVQAGALVETGAKLYRAYCAVPYCHGPEGKAGRAPQLAGRNYRAGFLFGTVVRGIPRTAMPEFANQLKTDEIEAVVQYVMSLKGEAPAAGAAQPVRRAVPPEAAPGRALFFDAARVGSCGACHEADGWGVPVAELKKATEGVVVTARPEGEAGFPAVVVDQRGGRVVVYDLGSPLPVRREFRAGRLTIEKGSGWLHQEATRIYSEAEREEIGRFLRWISER